MLDPRGKKEESSLNQQENKYNGTLNQIHRDRYTNVT